MQKAHIVIDNLRKGDRFVIGNKTIEFQNFQKDGFTWKIDGKRKKVYRTPWGEYVGTKGTGNDYLDQIMRDIAGLLILDLINLDNPFHEPSGCYLLLNK